ncbi:MAG: hypothetical protein Q8O40_12810 [Chloroflexota bacterium]|nr:hypothetical protein [Chloroflexota bacterium]
MGLYVNNVRCVATIEVRDTTAGNLQDKTYSEWVAISYSLGLKFDLENRGGTLKDVKATVVMLASDKVPLKESDVVFPGGGGAPVYLVPGKRVEGLQAGVWTPDYYYCDLKLTSEGRSIKFSSDARFPIAVPSKRELLASTIAERHYANCDMKNDTPK